MIVLVTMTAVFLTNFNSDYFTSRTNISSDSKNISVLVLLKGWENAAESFSKTDAVGIGFQQLGYSSLITNRDEITQQLKAFDLEHLNQYDAGSIAPKLVAEFGFFGIILILLYLFWFSKLLKNLKYIQNKPGIVFLYCCYLSIVFELFFRGVGYFSTGTFLLLACLTNFNSTKKSIMVVQLNKNE